MTFIHDSAKYRRIARKKNQEKGLCNNCGKTKNNKNRLNCGLCAKKFKELGRIRRAYKSELGICITCKEKAIQSNLCEKHWFKKCASRLKNCNWEDVKKKLDEQQWRCAYTDEILTFATMSLDHKIPRAHGGTDEISNLQWVTRIVNVCKNHILHEDFINMCYIIAKKFSSLPDM